MGVDRNDKSGVMDRWEICWKSRISISVFELDVQKRERSGAGKPYKGKMTHETRRFGLLYIRNSVIPASSSATVQSSLLRDDRSH